MRRGKRAGIKTITLAWIQWTKENEIDEMKLLLAKQQLIRGCCVHFFVEICFHKNKLTEFKQTVFLTYS